MPRSFQECLKSFVLKKNVMDYPSKYNNSAVTECGNCKVTFNQKKRFPAGVRRQRSKGVLQPSTVCQELDSQGTGLAFRDGQATARRRLGRRQTAGIVNKARKCLQEKARRCGHVVYTTVSERSSSEHSGHMTTVSERSSSEHSGHMTTVSERSSQQSTSVWTPTPPASAVKKCSSCHPARPACCRWDQLSPLCGAEAERDDQQHQRTEDHPPCMSLRAAGSVDRSCVSAPILRSVLEADVHKSDIGTSETEPVLEQTTVNKSCISGVHIISAFEFQPVSEQTAVSDSCIKTAELQEASGQPNPFSGKPNTSRSSGNDVDGVISRGGNPVLQACDQTGENCARYAASCAVLSDSHKVYTAQQRPLATHPKARDPYAFMHKPNTPIQTPRPCPNSLVHRLNTPVKTLGPSPNCSLKFPPSAPEERTQHPSPDDPQGAEERVSHSELCRNTESCRRSARFLSRLQPAPNGCVSQDSCVPCPGDRTEGKWFLDGSREKRVEEKYVRRPGKDPAVKESRASSPDQKAIQDMCGPQLSYTAPISLTSPSTDQRGHTSDVTHCNTTDVTHYETTSVTRCDTGDVRHMDASELIHVCNICGITQIGTSDATHSDISVCGGNTSDVTKHDDISDVNAEESHLWARERALRHREREVEQREATLSTHSQWLQRLLLGWNCLPLLPGTIPDGASTTRSAPQQAVAVCSALSRKKRKSRGRAPSVLRRIAPRPPSFPPPAAAVPSSSLGLAEGEGEAGSTETGRQRRDTETLGETENRGTGVGREIWPSGTLGEMTEDMVTRARSGSWVEETHTEVENMNTGDGRTRWPTGTQAKMTENGDARVGRGSWATDTWQMEADSVLLPSVLEPGYAFRAGQSSSRLSSSVHDSLITSEVTMSESVCHASCPSVCHAPPPSISHVPSMGLREFFLSAGGSPPHPQIAASSLSFGELRSTTFPRIGRPGRGFLQDMMKLVPRMPHRAKELLPGDGAKLSSYATPHCAGTTVPGTRRVLLRTSQGWAVRTQQKKAEYLSGSKTQEKVHRPAVRVPLQEMDRLLSLTGDRCPAVCEDSRQTHPVLSELLSSPSLVSSMCGGSGQTLWVTESATCLDPNPRCIPGDVTGKTYLPLTSRDTAVCAPCLRPMPPVYLRPMPPLIPASDCDWDSVLIPATASHSDCGSSFIPHLARDRGSSVIQGTTTDHGSSATRTCASHCESSIMKDTSADPCLSLIPCTAADHDTPHCRLSCPGSDVTEAPGPLDLSTSSKKVSDSGPAVGHGRARPAGTRQLSSHTNHSPVSPPLHSQTLGALASLGHSSAALPRRNSHPPAVEALPLTSRYVQESGIPEFSLRPQLADRHSLVKETCPHETGVLAHSGGTDPVMLWQYESASSAGQTLSGQLYPPGQPDSRRLGWRQEGGRVSHRHHHAPHTSLLPSQQRTADTHGASMYGSFCVPSSFESSSSFPVPASFRLLSSAVASMPTARRYQPPVSSNNTGRRLTRW